jgi:putative hydrolase of HD superfamily
MDIVRFFREAQKLKHLVRTGWSHKNVPDPESVADHTYGVALLAAVIDLPKDVDRDKLLKMAIIHDVSEVHVGDIVWEKGSYSNREKQERKHVVEKKAFNDLFDEEYAQMGHEWLDQASPEAKFLKDLDKIEMVFQALEYEERVPPETLDEFWENVDKYLKSKVCRDIFEELKKLRQGHRN